jgi:type II secretory pathway component PulF
MPKFRYTAVNSLGKRVSGVMEESDTGAATRALESNGLIPVKIQEKGARAHASGLPSLGGGRVGAADVLAFTEQLYALLEAGLPLDRALQVLLGTLENPALHQVVQDIYVEVEKGHTLAEAFAQHPKVFQKIYVNMIRAGEEGGILPVVLARLIEFYERSLEFRSFLITSSVYPLLLFVFGIVALGVLTVVVIPKFGQIFSDMGQQLPLAAAILVGASSFLTTYGWLLLALVACAIIGGHYYIRTPGGEVWWHTLLLRLPLLGRLLLKIQLARVTRTLGTLLGSGVPILTSISIVQGLTDSIPLRRALERLQQAVKEGKGVAQPLRTDPFFPPLLGHLAAVGEESGALDKMLLKVADQYDTDVRKATKAFIALFEPVMIVMMGGLIGAIVVSMLTAIFSINDLPL